MPSHTVTLTWMDRPVRTLEDLLRPGRRAVCVGINPSPVSVEVGHYYQGRLGQRFLDRLRRVGVLVGERDIVKRPTRRGHEPYAAEFVHGRRRLECELDRCAPQLVIFAYKATAVRLFGRFAGAGFQPWGAPGRDHFVMPGPMATAAEVERELAALRRYVRDRGWAVK